MTFDHPPPIPKDALRGPTRDVAAIPFFQRAADNQAFRDYLELQAELFHKGFRGVARAAGRTPAGRIGKSCSLNMNSVWPAAIQTS